MTKFAKVIGGIATAFILSTAAVSAATVSIAGNYSGGALGDVAFDFTITADFFMNYEDRTLGLTVNKLTSTVVSGDPFPSTEGAITYRYARQPDRLIFGGGSNRFASQYDRL